jgi:putative heme-binding domain-containing protein
VLGRFGDSEITDSLLTAYPDLAVELKSQVVEVLLRRPDSALKLLEEVQSATIAREEISTSQLRIAAIHDDDGLNRLIRELWGNIAPGTPEEVLATMRRYNNDLRAGSGDIGRGKVLYTRHCATCHVLFGEGGKVGPELTTANRGDLSALLANIVDPSAVVRREYINYTVATVDGRILTGLIAEQDAAGVTILDAKDQRTRLRRDEIDEIREAEVSLMPDRLLEQLSPRELRDLFAYLQQQPAQ